MEEKLIQYCKKQYNSVKNNPKIIIKKWWFWFLIIVLIYGIFFSPEFNNNSNLSSNTANIGKTENISTNYNNSTTSEEVKNTDTIDFNQYPKFLEDCIKKSFSNYNFLTKEYNISTLGNNLIEIHVYTNKYYSYNKFNKNISKFSKDFLRKIQTKKYEKKYFFPESVHIRITFCGYGKDLNSRKVNNYTQPLAYLDITTSQLKDNINVSEFIEIYKDWF